MSLQAVLGRVFGSVRLGSGRRLGSTAMLVAVGLSGVGVVGVGTAHAQGCDPVEVAKLLADDGEMADQFGTSISISGDTAVIGVRFDDDNGTDSGSAYVYTRSGGVWTQQAKLLPDDGAELDEFGIFVSIDDDTIVIGAHGDSENGFNSGSAYVFTRSGGVWTQQAKLVPTDGRIWERFGTSVSLSGDSVLIGAKNDDDNGVDSGSAYVYTRSGGDWTQQAKLLPDDGATKDFFGQSVSLSGDTAVIGAWKDDDNGTESGSAYVFTRSGGVWTEQAKLLHDDGAEGDRFGQSVFIEGDTALIGAYWDDDNGTDSGSAYIFTRSGGVWTEQAKLLPIDGAATDKFGIRVGLSGDTAVIGADHNDDMGTDSGSAYVFRYDGSGWVQEAKLLAADGAENDRLGSSVSVSGSTAMIGAHLDDNTNTDSGSVYVYDLDPVCPADLNGDCVVNTQDFLAFLGLWSAGDPLADWNGDGDINTIDFLAYLSDWVAGC